jgi:ABC-type sugar transport system ATPase subunit
MATLRLEHITKQFPGVKALDDITISIGEGQIHALCGENGAGKSTLMNIISGNLQPDNGTMLINGVPMSFRNPKEAFENKISIVYQHLSLVDSLSIAENIYANQQPRNQWGLIQYHKLYKQTQQLLETLKLDTLNPRTLVSKLSPAEKQMVEIAKAISKEPSIFILDEPTASLTDREAKTLFEILFAQRANGASIIYISHRLEEIFYLADKISVLKDGKYQGTYEAKELTKDALIQKMVGRELKAIRTGSAKTEDILLRVKNLIGRKFNNISFELHKGEIVGFSGLVGAGRTEIARAIFGLEKIASGEIIFKDIGFVPRHPVEAIRRGFAYVTEERKRLGLFPDMSVQDNIVAACLDSVMPGGIYDGEKTKKLASESKLKLKIAAHSIQQRVVNLSGGNQQKVMLAKWLLTTPEVLIVDEPTHGIDIGAKYEIYEIVKSLVAEGKSVIMISSELSELIGLCDRIIVIKKGTISGEVSGEDMTEENIMALAT